MLILVQGIMDKNKSFIADRSSLLWVTTVFFLLVFLLLSLAIFFGCRVLAVKVAENHLAGFLLNYNATRAYIENVQKQEVYRLQEEGLLYDSYFSPELLSSTYIARHISDLQNAYREEAGFELIRFKFAARNPRNPVNAADAGEVELLDRFNDGLLKEYKEVVSVYGEPYLYYALPIDRNRESCLRCHGDPASAPAELRDEYGDSAGFHEEVGVVRAFMSVRVPMDQLLKKAHQTAILLCAVTFLLLAGAYWLVQLLFHRAETQKRLASQNSSYLNSVLQASTDTAIIATDSTHRIQYFNHAAEQIFDFPAQEILGMDLVAAAQRGGVGSGSRLNDAICIVMERGDFKFRFDYRDKVLDIQMAKISDENADFGGFLIMGQDMTTSLEIERERDEIKSRLLKAEKMESLGLLASGVAHDLNNILAGIINYPELLMMKLPADSPLQPSLQAILQSGQRAAAVVEDLLTVARGAAAKKELCDLNQLLYEYLASPEFDALRKRYSSIQLVYELKDDPVWIHCSPIHIKKCIMNLVGNAFEAIDGSGVVRFWLNVSFWKRRPHTILVWNRGNMLFCALWMTAREWQSRICRIFLSRFIQRKNWGEAAQGLVCLWYGIRSGITAVL